MNIPLESEIGDHETGSSKDACGLSQRMDQSRDGCFCDRVPCRIGENSVKTELCSPGPATPIQAAPLPQQKPREDSKSYTTVASTRPTHSFQAANSSSEAHVASRPLKSLSASTQDAVQSQKENSSLVTPANECSVGGSQTLQKTSPHVLAGKPGLGHPSLNRALATSVDATKPVLTREVVVQSPSKTAEVAISMSNCGVFERASSDRSIMSMGRLNSNLRAESYKYAMDAGLCIGSNALQISGSKESACRDFSRVWENLPESVGQSGVSYVPSSRSEGAVVLQLSQGRGVYAEGGVVAMAMDSERKGNHGQGSFGFREEGRPQKREIPGKVEHRFSEVLKHNSGVGVERGSSPCTDSRIDRSTKRVKREVVETRMPLNDSREQMWVMNGDQDRRRNGMYEMNQDNVRSLIFRNGPTCLAPQSHRERALGKVVDVANAEPKTMVVKKTPKRVHNSDPNSLYTRSELLMLEGSSKSPRSVPHVMFMSSNKQGADGVMLASDLAHYTSQQRVRESPKLVCGGESGVDCSNGRRDGSSVQPSQIESRFGMDSRSSMLSKQAVLLGEPCLPLTLNFSPTPQRPVVSISRTSTGVSCSEEEWGKSLALCGPGGESPGEVERNAVEAKAMSYEDRFVQLQVFLKKCDEDDQSYLLDALRSLSAAARSSHAVQLEQRALWLSIEEGKEMTRLKSLNVMGQRRSIKTQNEVGCSAQGVVPSFGSSAEYAQQQLAMRSPPMQIQMLMSSSMPGSAYTESCFSG